MYTRSAQFYDRLYHFKDYAGESARVQSWIDEHHPEAASLLDVGCATGRHVEYLQAHYACEGLDISPELLGIARRRCPNLTFHLASMTDFRLGGQFDVVTCLFSAIAMGATSKPVLDQTLSAFAAHLRPGGLLIVEPWFTPETYWTGTITANFVNEPDLKIAWMYHSRAEAGRSVLDVQYLVGTVGSIDHFSERLECSLFEHAEYLDAFEESGLRVWHEPDAFGRGMYFGRKP